MLSLLEAYLKQVRDTLHDVVKLIKDSAAEEPKAKRTILLLMATGS